MQNIRFLVNNRFQSYGSDDPKDTKRVDKKMITTSKKGQGFGNLRRAKSYFGLRIFTKDLKGCFSMSSSRYQNDIDNQEQIMV